jgi:hypothetical protein
VFGVLHTSGQALLDGDLRAIRLEHYESFRTFVGITPRDGKKSQSHKKDLLFFDACSIRADEGLS